MIKSLIKIPLKLTSIQCSVIVIIRISMGLFFATTGFNKLFVEKNQLIMLETIAEAGIPFPEFMSVFVSAAEFGFGLMLIMGLFTHLSSLVLSMICVVAFFTVGIHTIPADLDTISWLSWFFYVHDLLYILLLFVLLTHLPDDFTLDHHLLNYWSDKKGPE